MNRESAGSDCLLLAGLRSAGGWSLRRVGTRAGVRLLSSEHAGVLVRLDRIFKGKTDAFSRNPLFRQGIFEDKNCRMLGIMPISRIGLGLDLMDADRHYTEHTAQSTAPMPLIFH
ncbi:hypothetical protein [Steroidobacter agaridevorans]|uniref:hypothetical protein n=1 Tax=Steroidobacter agaridevorans TaxID=2695856 RepID=UPI00137B1C86|nr:hypothetical protein [Steroidobacter agaridevorans]